MTSKGQITIPKDVRDELSLEPGTRFYVTVVDGELKVVTKNRSIADLAGILGTPPRGAGASLDDIDRAIAEHIAEDDRRISREWHQARKGDE